MESEGSDHDPIEQTIDRFIRNELLEVRTCQPGQIVSYDPATCSATAQPAIQTMGSGDDATPESLDPIPFVPVLQLGGGGFYQTFPLRKGDPVWLQAADRSLSAWKASTGSPVDPQVAITHSIGDSIAIPGLSPLKHAPSIASATDYVLGAIDGSIEFRLTPAGKCTLDATAGIDITAGTAGKITIGNDAAELLSMFDALIGYLQSAVVVTALGPQPLANILPQLAALKAQLALLKG